MKKILAQILLVFLLFSNFSLYEANAFSITIKAPTKTEEKPLTLWEMFIYFGNLYNGKIPETYKYIDLKFYWIRNNKALYEALQKLVYVDKIKNAWVYIKASKKISLYNLYSFAEKNYKINLWNYKKESYKKTKATIFDLMQLKRRIEIKKAELDLWNEFREIKYKKDIFIDVYKTLNTQTYYKDKLDKRKMLEEAIKWLTKATDDKFTVYFPPTNNKDFKESLKWKYEWIWAYVDMEKPWVLRIVSPISGSPAEKAWLKWGDIVIKVDWKEITDKNNIHEVVSWIKGPAGTTVVLTIKRWNKIFDITVTRAKIVIKEVEIKKIRYDTYLVKLKFFWEDIAKEFRQALEEIKKDKSIKKIIFDLRWNWGWYLDQVAEMLSYFVPAWEKTVIVKYYSRENAYYSKWYDLIDFSKYKIVLLENSWTASASEIFIGTIKDYYEDATIIWEKSYWKGSVQTIKWYSDGSALKYTIAKWFTGKTKTWIDWIWIKPDIEIKMEKYWVEEYKDKQLQKALQIR